MENTEYKSIPGRIELKEEGADGRLHIRAYALAFGNVDSYGDIILPTACDRWLASEDAGRLALCYQHDMSDVIGIITDKGTDSYGLWFEADILPTSSGTDVQVLIKAGAISEFSIGYYAVGASYELRDGEEVRVLSDITVVEVSPVTRAANPRAVLVDMKSEQPRLERLSDDQLSELSEKVSAEIQRRIFNQITITSLS